MAKTTTLSLLDWSIVDQLYPRNSYEDETSPESPGPETPRHGGAAKSGIGLTEPREQSENQEAKAAIGRPDPVATRKPIQE